MALFSGAKMNITNATYWLSIAAMSFILIWGLRLLSQVLKTTPEDKSYGRLASALTEKSDDTPDAGFAPTSFSRVSGFIGSLALAAAFVGLGYWVLYELFFEHKLAQLKDLLVYALAGSALYAPYAFNQLASIFKN